MNSFEGLYHVRDYKESDKSFILSTFLRGLYYGDSWFSLIDKKIFMDNYKHIAEKIVSSPNTTIRVACLIEEPDVILGYSILSTNKTIVWVYVKSVWRKRGIGRTLTPEFPTAVTHLTALGKSLLTKIPGAVFNPFKPI